MSYDHLIGAGFERWSSGKYTPGQRLLMGDFESPLILYTGSYRAGKTEIVCRAAIRHMLAFPGSRVGVFRARLRNLKQSTLRTFLELIDPSWVESWNNSELELRLFNGSSATFLGCEFADRIGSIELSAAIIDEAHEINPESLGMIAGRMSKPLTLPPGYLDSYPAYKQYAESTQGIRQTWLVCNPKSTNHWLYKDFLDPETALPGRKFYSSNTLNNTNLPASYVLQNLHNYARPGVDLDALSRSVTAIRRGDSVDPMALKPLLTPFGQRNLLGLWVALEGAIFEIDQDLHVNTSELQQIETYAGVDFGYHHPRIVVAELCEGRHLRTIDYWHDTNSTPDDVVNALERLKGKHNLRGVFLPPDQPGIIQKARDVLGASTVLKAPNKVLPGIGAIQDGLGGNWLTFKPAQSESWDLFISECEGYSWKRDRDGNWLDEPLKEDDHFPDALRYLVYGLVKLRRVGKTNTQTITEDLPGTDDILSAMFG